MRYFYERPEMWLSMYGQLYFCDHPVYDRCTLYQINGRGLAVIQQRYSPDDKSTWWGEIDPWLTDEIYLNPLFLGFFDEYAGYGRDGLYPAVTLRQIMWALKMKPFPREPWETGFDRKII